MPPLNVEQSVADLAASSPAALRVLQRHHVDVHHHAQRRLAEACVTLGLDPRWILLAIEREEARHAQRDVWATRSTEQIIQHLVAEFHQPLLEELPRLQALSEQVARAHSGHSGERVIAVRELVGALVIELEEHLIEEETVVFPWILSGAKDAQVRLRAVDHDHRAAEHLILELRRTTNDYRVPKDADARWVELWKALYDLDADLCEHMWIEDEILFPRALGKAAVNS